MPPLDGVVGSNSGRLPGAAVHVTDAAIPWGSEHRGLSGGRPTPGRPDVASCGVGPGQRGRPSDQLPGLSPSSGAVSWSPTGRGASVRR